MSRLLLVSHRLPVTARLERGELVVAPAAGGVATGLAGLHERADSRWIGSPGDVWRLRPEQRAELEAALEARRAIGVPLDARLSRGFADEFANGLLWPVLHYQVDRLPLDPRGWEAYRSVNERFADAIVREHEPGDLVWVHDYQLMLVPGLVRERLPEATIGFFLHVPFPSSEVFRVLRWRRELLEGMLGADLVGFHTASYADHFRSSAARILGCRVERGRVAFGGRHIRVGPFPMGIDAATYARLAGEREVRADAARLRASGDVTLVVAVDRLDYTKGIPRRLLAVERCLERHPGLRRRLRLVQVAAPTREAVGAYREYRREVDELVGRINGRFGSIDHQPIHYVSRTLSRERLVALYVAADVALVTPLRDGMNLVAKEFVAARLADDGVLILSEFAGAASELSGAIVVNPYDLDAVADAVAAAVEMPVEEQERRMRSLRGRVLGHDVETWSREFISALRREGRGHRAATDDGHPVDSLEAIVEQVPQAGPLAMLLDYDGTLMPFHARPEDARPDDEILRLLAVLAGLPEVTVDVVSGRRRVEVDAWLGHLPIGLHAEHGLWSRSADEARPEGWRRRLEERPGWIPEARRRMTSRARHVPGSTVEEKEASVVWHYRTVAEPLGEREAADLRSELATALRDTDAQVTEGSRIVEVRETGLHKGVIVDDVRRHHPRARLLVVGDDTTDEDMFAAAPVSAVTVHVGGGDSGARFRVAGPERVRILLADVARRRGSTELGR